MNASTSPGHDDDRVRAGAYVVVALVALLTGYVLGLLGGQRHLPAGQGLGGSTAAEANAVTSKRLAMYGCAYAAMQGQSNAAGALPAGEPE